MTGLRGALLSRTRRRRDQGAAVAVVVILLSGGVLLGMGALTIDVGSLLLERRQLVNAATAVSLAAAQDCGSGATCSPVAGAYQGLADQDAIDGRTAIDGLCASSALRSAFPATPLPACPATPVPTPLASCPPPSAALAGSMYIEARTSTLTSTGTILPPVFAQTLVPGYTGTHEQACARASFGPVAAVTSSRVTVSSCAWDSATSGGDLTTLAPRPPYAVYPTNEVDLTANDFTTGCLSRSGGAVYPTINGGFAWSGSASTCEITSRIGGRLVDAGGPLAPSGCDLAALWQTTIIVPVYDGTYLLDGRHHVSRLAAFFVSGYQVGGIARDGQPSVSTGGWCSADPLATCLSGWFTTDQVQGATVSPTTVDSGVVAIQVSG